MKRALGGSTKAQELRERNDNSTNRTMAGEMDENNDRRQNSEGWFEDRDSSKTLPVRFVERRKGDRRRSGRATIDALPPLTDPAPTVSLIIPTRNEARNVAEVLSHIPDIVTEVLLVDTVSSDVTKLMAQ